MAGHGPLVDPNHFRQLQTSARCRQRAHGSPQCKPVAYTVQCGLLRVKSPCIVNDGNDGQRDWKVNDEFMNWNIKHSRRSPKRDAIILIMVADGRDYSTTIDSR